MKDYFDPIKISGYSGRYELRCDAETSQPYVHNIKFNRRLKGYEEPSRYIRAILIDDNGKIKFHYLHRLIAEHLIPRPNPAQRTDTDHINRDKTDNRLSNLRWLSRSLNIMNVDGKRGFIQTGVNKWRPILRGKKIGESFETPNEAHSAYIEAKRKIFEDEGVEFKC